MKVCRCTEVFFNRHVVASIETSVLKEVCILHYLHNRSTMVILKFKKAERRILS